MKPSMITRRSQFVRLDVCFVMAAGVLAMAATSNAESKLDGKTLLQQHSPLPARTPEAGDPLMHHESPDERSLRLRMAPSERRSSPSQTWIRDAYLSIQVNVDDSGNNILNDAANEPSIAVDPTDPTRIAVGWRQFDTIASNFRQAGLGYSADRGDTWTFPGVLDPGTFRSDPVLGYDAEGNFYYNSLAWPAGSNPWCDVFKSTDGGATWDGGTYAHGGDKQWMAIDRTGGIGHGNIYMNWSLGYSSCSGNFTRSYDNGATFEPCTTLPGSPYHGTCAVGPDGELYICGAGFTVLKSTTLQDETLPYQFDLTTTVSLDGSKTGSAGPNPGGLLGQVEIDVDCSEGPYRGNVYLLCSVQRYSTADPLDVMIARSTDGGETWSDPVRINDDPADNGAWQWFGTMSVSPDDGRIDVTWNDTRNDPGGYDSELYYSYSEDGGVTWSPNVPLSPSFDPHLGWPQQNKLGDYSDMISDDIGVHVAYAATFNGEEDVYYLRIGDCNHNGVADAVDVSEGTSEDCTGNGIPDECEVDCNDNGQADSCDLLYGISEDCTDNGIPDECEPDCNDNGEADSCDVFYGTSPDCNENQVPDECDISDATSDDCNDNGVPDECDIADGTSLDLNYDGIPDECECRLTESVKVVADGGAMNDMIGFAVALDGQVAVVGAPGDDDGCWADPQCNSGSAHVYSYAAGAWNYEVKLVASDDTQADAFGRSVAIDDDLIVIGAPGDYPGGSVYVFRLMGDEWTEEAKVKASDTTGDSQFGQSVSVEGNVIVVGDHGNTHAGTFSGAAYVLRFDGSEWVEEAKLTASDAAQEDFFGYSVSLGGDAILIGAPLDDVIGLDSGSAYAFRYDGTDWSQESKLTPSGATADDAFGAAVSLSGDVAIIGAALDDQEAYDAGAVYFYQFDGTDWVQDIKLTASDAEEGDILGLAVAIDGDMAVAGAFLEDYDAFDAGSAYVFHHNGTRWVERAKLNESTPASEEHFGRAVAINGSTAVIGAVDDDGIGSAHIFGGVSECNDNSRLDACDILNGTSEDCSDNWIPDECEPDCNDTGVADSCDIVDGVSEDCNGNEVPDECEPQDDCNENGVQDICDLAGGTSEDCNYNDIPDECDIAAGTSEDCNENVIPDECETDCNDNGVPDDCDIADGTSEDCTGNGIPDECEPDCNENGVADSCDILFGTSHDWNENGVPDDCECEGWDCCNLLPDAPTCLCDVNNDGYVTPADVGLIKYHYSMTSDEHLCRYDVDCSGAIDPSDVGLTKLYYGPCGTWYPCFYNP